MSGRYACDPDMSILPGGYVFPTSGNSNCGSSKAYPFTARWPIGASVTRRRSPSVRSRFIGEALATGAGKQSVGPLDVLAAHCRAVGEAEVELPQVALQVGFRDVLIDAVQPSLEDREIAFNAIGGDIAPDVFLGAVVDG